MDIFFKRRSIRAYTSESVSDENIDFILKAGMSAPSAGNEQPWHFVVIRDRTILDAIPAIHPHSEMLHQAPVAILTCGDLSLEKHVGYWVQDCSAATENMLLAVTSRGLGSVWLGVYPRQDRVEGLRKLLTIPEHVIPFALIPIGCPGENKPVKTNFDLTKIHYNTWG